MAKTQLSQGIAVAGVQEKLSLHLDLTISKRPRLAVVGYPSGYILKPQASDYKNLPEFEQAAMLMANACGFKTVPHALIPIEGGHELAFISKRIDRDSGKKIHMEDFCQASGLPTSLKYRSSYEACAELIDRYSAWPLLDKTTFFSLLYFGFVIGNSDMHLKNFSFVVGEDGKYHLCPAYDLLPTKVILPTDHDDLGLLMNGHKSNLRSHDFDRFCEAAGIPKASQTKIMENIDAKIGVFEEIIATSSIHQNGKSRWVKMIRSNIKRSKRP